MTLTKEQSKQIDEVLNFLHSFREPTLQLGIYKNEHDPTADVANLKMLMLYVYNYQKRNNHLIIATIDGDPIDKMQDLEWFIKSGGFTSIWEENEKERQLKDDIKTVNDYVKTTNVYKYLNFTTQIIISSISGLIAIVALIISYLSYKNSNPNDEIKTRLRQLELQETKTQQQLQQNKRLTVVDTVHSIIVIDTIK